MGGWKTCALALGGAIAILMGASAHSVQVPRPVGGDSRIKVINYMPNSVFRYMGHFTYHSIIEFAPEEDIKTITMGVPTAWQITPEKNRIFLKPIADEATTNMTVITNKRMYFFEMHAEEADGINDRNLSFMTKFIYPDNDGQSLGAGNTSEFFPPPDLLKPELYNFKYQISGKASIIEPLLIFDDGAFTYFRFRKTNTELPAIFSVDSSNKEALVNYRVLYGYVIVEKVCAKFTLRHGKDIICVYNNAFNSISGGTS